MSELIEIAREMLIAESIGLISPEQLTSWADEMRLGRKNPPHFLAAISCGESAHQYASRLDLKKFPIEEADQYPIIRRASMLYEKGRIDLKTLSLACERLGRCSSSEELAGSLLWLSSEIDLCLIGIKNLDTSVPGIQQELKKCIEYATLPKKQKARGEIVAAE